MKRIVSAHTIFDLHCDLLYYLANTRNSHPAKKEDIGCAIPYLQNGNVKLQVMAAHSNVEKGSVNKMIVQANILQQLINGNNTFTLVSSPKDLENIIEMNKIGVILSLENASGICEENEPLENAFVRLNNLIRDFGKILYISFTHHGENRFGGGNQTNIGLKNDGKSLLDYINEKKIAVDLSHSSDALAYEILNYIDKFNLDILILASHSNFRSVYEHARNLPDELAKEIINRNGLIGMNFLRAVIHPENPEKLIEHILHGYHLNAGGTICFGADFFYTKSHPDKSRIPFFFKEHENAEKYQDILLSSRTILKKDEIAALAHQNVINFINRLWKEDHNVTRKGSKC
jgi:microsomal dipeptidase-like Zn-dependent dipeptidase